jgi:hypothetical protein
MDKRILRQWLKSGYLEQGPFSVAEGFGFPKKKPICVPLKKALIFRVSMYASTSKNCSSNPHGTRWPVLWNESGTTFKATYRYKPIDFFAV